MSYKICMQCDSSSAKLPQMEETIVQKWIPGTQHEVKKYVCPMCGTIKGDVNTHGVAISQAEYDALVALSIA